MDKIEIRKATKKDLLLIQRIKKEFLGTKIDKIKPISLLPSVLELERKEHKKTIFIATMNGALAGYVWLDANEKFGEVISIGVRKKFQRLGIASTLERKAAQFFIKKGVKKVLRVPVTKEGIAFIRGVAKRKNGRIRKNKQGFIDWFPKQVKNTRLK